jgi:hypothetical protein
MSSSESMLRGIGAAKAAYSAGQTAPPRLGRSVNRALHTGGAKSAQKYLKNQVTPKEGYLNFMSKETKRGLQRVSQNPNVTHGKALNALHGVNLPARRVDAESLGDSYGRQQENPLHRLKPYTDRIGAYRSSVPGSWHQQIEHLNKGKSGDGLDAYNRTFYGNSR